LISVGGREVIFSETLLCPFGEEIDLKVSVPNEEELWELRIRFSDDEKEEGKEGTPKPYMNFTVEKDVWIFNFANWNNSIGSTISTPAEIAESTGGQAITMLTEIAKLPGLHRAKIQIMIKERDNG